MSTRDLILRNPQICGAEPIIKDTRIALRTALASLADGDTVDDIVRSFPTLTREHVQAARGASRIVGMQDPGNR